MRRKCLLLTLGCLLGLSAFGQNQTIQLAWDASPDPTVTNYNLCWGATSNPYPYTNTFGTNLSGLISNLTPGVTYTFACQAEDTNGLMSDFCPAVSYTVPLACQISMSGLVQTYTGQPVTVWVGTSPANVPVTVTYNGGSSAPVNAGSYTVVATAVSTNYAGSATNLLTIIPASATVTMQNLTQTYSGAPQPVAVSTAPAGLATVVTYNGLATPPTAPGSYTVAASIVDNNYAGGATNVLVISPAGATLALGNLTQSYTGSAEAVSVTTTPAGLPVTVTYNGSATVPVDAGSYAVVATSTSTTYSGSVSGTLVINPAQATIVFSNLAQTFSGVAEPVTAVTSPTNLTVNITYNGLTNAPVNVGSYTVVGTVINSNYAGSATNILQILPNAPQVVFNGLAQTYTGSPETVTVATVPANLTTSLTYNGSTNAPINAGTYTVVCAVTGSNYSGFATNTMVISPAVATVRLAKLVQSWTGSPLGVLATTAPGSLGLTITYNGSVQQPTALGTYTVVATINDSNYTGSVTGTFVIKTVAPPSRLIITWNAAYAPVTLFESNDLMGWSESPEMPDSASNNPSDTITTSIPLTSAHKFFVATSNGRGVPIGISTM